MEQDKTLKELLEELRKLTDQICGAMSEQDLPLDEGGKSDDPDKVQG
jgi:hypothetical protein